jgi:hypothetical protein
MIDDENIEDDEELAEEETDEAPVVEDEVSDNVGDPSVEINVEELIHELEAQGLASKIGREQDTRRRLEELMERKRARRDLEDFEDYEI